MAREAAGELVIAAGPDAGRSVHVGVGRSILGRGQRCTFPIHDPHLEPHHLLFDADEFGGLSVTQLAGRRPMLVEATPAVEPVRTHTDVTIEVGATRLEWRPWGPGIEPQAEQNVGSSAASAVQIGLVDSCDRAFGLDVATSEHRLGHVVELSTATRALTISGEGLGPYLRAIVGQLVGLGWSVQSGHPEAPCDIIQRAQSERCHVRTASRDSLTDMVSDPGVDLLITVDEGRHTEATVDMPPGAVLFVGERSRGRYIADSRTLEATRLHLVGWHAATFAERCQTSLLVPKLRLVSSGTGLN